MNEEVFNGETIAEINLHKGDCLPFLKTLKSGSVDLVVTDPPYEIKNTNPGNTGRMADRIRKSMKELDTAGICKEFKFTPAFAKWVYLKTGTGKPVKVPGIAKVLIKKALVWERMRIESEKAIN